MQDNKTKLIGLIVIALLAVAGTGAVVVLNNQSSTTSGNASTNASSSTTTSDTAATPQQTKTTGSYKDGTYDADGSYRTPGGTEKVHVKVTLVNNAITAVEVTGSGSGESAQYQSMFKEGISDAVVGKDINQIQVSRVSGSSLTSTGFNNAIETIKQDATTAA